MMRRRASHMHILILNQTFYPDVAATAQHMWDLARHLRAHGHRVTALTSRIRYGTDQPFEHARETIDGIEIRRMWQTRFGKRHLPGRLCDFLSFYASALIELFRCAPPDVILALSSPPMISVLGLLARLFRRRTDGGRIGLVYQTMDVYPDAAVAMGVLREDSLVARIMRRLTGRTLQAADAVVALGEDMKDLLVRRYRLGPSARRRIAVVHPWSDGRELSPLPRPPGSPTFHVVYSGNLGMAHDADTLAAAINLTRDDPTIRWTFVGAGRRFDDLRSRFGQDPRVEFLDYEPRARLNESLNRADVHLVSQAPQFTGLVVPSKLFGILAVGKPCLMVGPAQAECSRIISRAEAGFVIPNGRADALVARIRQLRDEPALRERLGANGRRAFERLFDRPIACERMRKVIESAAGPTRGDRQVT